MQGNPIKLTDPFGLCPNNDIQHFILDMIGFVPVVGDIVDAVHAVWYAMEGDYWDAAMSAISVLPIIGDMVGVGGKAAVKIGKSIKNGDNIGDIIKSVEKVAGKTGGNAAEKAGSKAAKEAAEEVAEEAAEKGTKKTASEAAGDIDKNGSGTYTAPSGGGGVTSTIKVNGKTVSFGHGGRHLEGTGLNVDSVNQALANEVSTINFGTGQFHKGRIVVDGITIEYTSYGVSEGVINVGTYYPVQ